MASECSVIFIPEFSKCHTLSHQESDPAQTLSLPPTSINEVLFQVYIPFQSKFGTKGLYTDTTGTSKGACIDEVSVLVGLISC